MISELVFGILLLYCLFLLSLIYGWVKTESRSKVNHKPKLKYSILIPFRNEANNLPDLLRSLEALNFPNDHFEVIFIDDHSNDDFELILKSNYKLIKLEEGEGKKAALTLGIAHSRGEIILTTDADCILPIEWLSSYAFEFENNPIGVTDMAFGGVTFLESKSLFQKLQLIEFASLIGSGAATLKLGLPSMCNGANLAFRKSIFLETSGYEGNQHLPSGDDEFLMHKIYKLTGKVRYVKSKEAVVLTNAKENFKQFFQQRKRWASKWKYYRSFLNTLLALLVAIFNFSVLAAVFILITAGINVSILTLLFAKASLEFLLLFSVLRSLNKKIFYIPFIILQITYPIYVILFGLAANFGDFEWKGRRHKL